MSKHELDLLDNAVDSLNEALRKYDEGVAGSHGAFKYAILHFSHFMELLLKYHVSQTHPLLIYKNPFSKKIATEQTIGIWEAVQFLKNDGHDVPDDFFKDLEWFKKLRNEIEHYKFSLDVDQVKSTLGRLMQGLHKINNVIEGFNLQKRIDAKFLKTFEMLADEYKARLIQAQEKAEEISDSGFAYNCWACGNSGTVSRVAGKYTCQYCGDVTRELECCICGGDMPELEAIVWNDDDPENIEYICEGCHNRIWNSN